VNSCNALEKLQERLTFAGLSDASVSTVAGAGERADRVVARSVRTARTVRWISAFVKICAEEQQLQQK